MKKLKKMRLIGIIGFVVVVVACFIMFMAAGTNEAVAGIGVLILFVGVPVFLIIFAIANKKLKRVCTSCGESLDGAAYSYQLVSEKYENGRLTYNYQIIVTCPECDVEKKFNYSFSCSSGVNPVYKVEDYCRKTFGH